MKARVLASTLAVALSVFASAQADHSKAYWVKQYNAIANMFATKNTKAFIATLDPKFVLVDDKGKTYSRAEFIKMEVGPIAQASSVGGSVTVTGLHVSSDKVAVDYDWRYNIVTKSPKGKVTDIGREVGTDTWHKVHGKWLTVKTVIKSASDKTTNG